MKIIFTRPKNDAKIFSLAIRLVEKRNFSHSAIVIKCPASGKKMVFHAASGMVHPIEYNRFLQDNIVVKSYFVSDDKLLETWEYCLSMSGYKYSVKQIFSIFVQKIFRVNNFYSNGEKEQICSEFVYESPLIENRTQYERDAITPSNLQKVVENIYG